MHRSLAHALVVPVLLPLSIPKFAPSAGIDWETNYAAALERAREEEKILFVAVNMDGERANDRMVKDVYTEKAIRELSEHTVNLIASASAHDDAGECSRFGGVTCEQHRLVDVDVRKNVLRGDASGSVVAPQHVFLSPAGEVILSVPYEISASELQWCFHEALETVSEEFDSDRARGARRPRRLIVGDVIAEGGDTAKPITRAEALKIISELKKGVSDSERSAQLRRLVTADEPEARAYVTAALRAGGDGKKDADAARRSLVRWIGTASPKTYWEVVEEFADSGTPSVKREAVVALEQLASPESLATLMKALRRASDPIQHKNIVRAIGASARGDKKARKRLLAESEDKRDPRLRANALIAIGWLDADEEVDERLRAAALPAEFADESKIELEDVTLEERMGAVVAMGISRRGVWSDTLDRIVRDQTIDQALRDAATAAKKVIAGGEYGLLRDALRRAGGDELPRDRLFPEIFVR